MSTSPETRLEQAVAHAQFLRAVARAVLGGDADAEDVLQETFLVAWQTEPRKGGPLRAWLAGVARRLALSRRRSSRRREAREWQAAASELQPSVEDVALREETRQVLVAALLGLEEPYRTTLLWRYYSGRSVAEIAGLQAVPVNTVRTRVQRGLARLRARLSAAHAGDDRRWRCALMPLAGGGVALGPTAAVVLGGLFVKKAVVGGLVALLLVGAGVALWRGGPEKPVRSASGAGPLVASARGADTAGASQPKLAGPGMDPAPRTAVTAARSYAGQVVDQAGRGVGGARVEVRGVCNDDACTSGSWVDRDGAPLAAVETAVDGRFQLPAEFARAAWDVRPHAVWIHVHAEGFAPAEAAVVHDRPAHIVLSPGGALSLSLVDEGGRPVREARIEVYRGEAEIPPPGWGGSVRVWAGAAGDQGRLERRLVAGTYRVRVTAAGFRPIHTEALELAEGARIERTIKMDAGIVVEVQASGPDGLPLAGARVRALGPLGSSGEARTDSDGRAVVPGIGLPLDQASAFRYGTQAVEVHYAVEAAGLAGVYGWRRLPLGPDRVRIEVQLRSGVELRVQVVDSEGGRVPEPVARWEPAQGDSSQSFLAEFVGADGEGWIVLPRVPPGARSVEVKSLSEGWVARTVPVTVSEREPRMRVVLARSDGFLVGRVLLPDGSVAVAGRVDYEPEREASQPPEVIGLGPVGLDGTFRQEALPTGKGAVAVHTPGRAAQRFPVTVVSARPREPLLLRLRLGRLVRGRVVDRADVGLAGVTVGAQTEVPWMRQGRRVSSSRTEVEVKTGVEGRFEFELEEGIDVRLVPTLAGWQPMQGNPDRSRAGELDVVLRMKPKAEPWGLPLHLRVTSGGKPYTGALDILWEHPTGNRMATYAGSDGKGLYDFGIWGDPGRFTLTLHARGHRPTHLRDVELDETPEGVTREVALDRGSVFGLRVRDAAGRPMADAQVDVNGEPVQLDARGEVEVGGFERDGPPLDLSVRLTGDPEFTATSVRIVERSGMYEVLLRRTGVIAVRFAEAWSAVRSELHVRVVGVDGQVLDEVRHLAARVQGHKGDVGAVLRVPVDGTFRVLATLDGRSGESVVEVRVGTRVETRVELSSAK